MNNYIKVMKQAFRLTVEEELNSSQQLIMLHAIHRLNGNMWRDIKLPITHVAASTHLCKRTVSKQINELTNKGLLAESDGRFNLGYKFTGDTYENFNQTS